MLNHPKSIFLADDDLDDCSLFEEVLNEIPIATELTTAHDGVELMQQLSALYGELPFVLFLDLNMPRKNGFECLDEIKQNDKLKFLDVVVFSTSFNQNIAEQLFKSGAKLYLQKPDNYNLLKKLVYDVLTWADDFLSVSSHNSNSINSDCLPKRS